MKDEFDGFISCNEELWPILAEDVNFFVGFGEG